MPDELEVARLRFELAAVDRSLVLLLSLRERLQHRVLRTKAELGLPLFDAQQEAVVRRRARAWAGRYGGSPELAEAAIGAAVEAGRDSFTRRFASPTTGRWETVAPLPGPDLDPEDDGLPPAPLLPEAIPRLRPLR